MKIKSIHIDDYKVFKDFDISFLGSNGEALDLIVLAGINGSGKTTLFEYIVKKGKLGFSEKKGSINLDIKNFNIENVNEVNMNSNSSHEDFMSLYGEKALIELAVAFSDNIKYIKAQEQKTEDIKKEIVRYVDIQIFEKELSAKEAYEVLTNTIDEIFNGLDLQVKFSGLDREKNIFFTNELNEKISIDELSTGEKELLSKIFYLYISDIKDSIVLIDEPEISLHPSWQNKIIKIYKNFAKQNNNQIIIATHSPQIVASTPNESLRVLVKENNTIKSLSLDAYGMQVNKALTDVMGEL